MVMKKRGMSTLFLVILAIVIIAIAGAVYYYTTQEKVVLTPKEQKIAESLDLTPKEFNETYTQTYDVFIKDKSMFEGFERSEIQKMISYSKLSLEEAKKYNNFEGFKLKPDSKIILVEFIPIQPTPHVLYLIEDGEIKVLVGSSKSRGLS